jgi:hypothetical protein
MRPKSTLLRLSPLLLPGALTSQSLLGSSLVAGLEIERVFLDVLDDVLLLYFPLETAESTFNGLTLLDLDFSHGSTPPFPLEFRLPGS